MAQQEQSPQVKYIGDEIEDLIQRIRATERDYLNQEEVKRVLSEAIEVLKSAENAIKSSVGPSWFIVR